MANITSKRKDKSSAYQVVFLGKPYMKRKLQARIDKSHYKFIYPSANRVNANWPVLYLYMGQSPQSVNFKGITSNQLVEWCNRGCILPIVTDLNQFKQYIPKELSSINALEIPLRGDVFSLENYIYSYFGITYTHRKVFISYKRDDIKFFAHQLFDQLVHAQYDVFLDTCSIAPGLQFQAKLREELEDSDIVLLLNTKNCLKSNYVIEEIKLANSEQIPTLVVDFLDADTKKIENVAPWSDHVKLKNAANPTYEYKTDTINAVVRNVERLLAVDHFRKRRYIVKTFIKKENKEYLKEYGELLISKRNRKCYFPLTHIPQTKDIYFCFNIMNKYAIASRCSKNILFLGDQCTLKTASELQWLNNNLKDIKLKDINNKIIS